LRSAAKGRREQERSRSESSRRTNWTSDDHSKSHSPKNKFWASDSDSDAECGTIFVDEALKAFNALSMLPTETFLCIRKRYFQLARDIHPDKNSSVDATSKMQQVNEAYSYLESVYGDE